MALVPTIDATEIEVDDETGAVTVKAHGGEDQAQPKPSKFDDNLAEVFSLENLGTLAEAQLRGIAADERSREGMLTDYTSGMDLLGLKIEPGPSGNATGQGGKGISRVRDPTLLWACVRFQAGARNELLPANGPVKAKIDGAETSEEQQLAADFEQDFNHYLTVTASEYYPDTDRGLFYLAYGGTLFKKVYHCPLRERPVSECVYLPDLIVSNDATDLQNAIRVTHKFEMSQDTVKQLQESGFYLDISLAPPTESGSDRAKQKEGQIAGVSDKREQQEDKQHTIYECYTELDLSNTHEEKGAPKRALPYRVSIDKDSRKILEIRRNWKEGDPKYRRRKRFVKYGLIPGFGFYDYGFLHLLGNHAKAMTALLRLLIDGGMFSSFPGGLRLKGARSSTNEYRPGPGEFPEVDGSTGIDDIRKLIMPLPYKEPSAVVVELWQLLKKDAAQIAGTVELELGEGRTNMPVGTILSMIEQQTQVMSAVHKRSHASQQEELLLLKELFEEDPTALYRFAKDPARNWETAQEFADQQIVPSSDPNVPAQIHRIMQGTILWSMATAAPQLFNQPEVVKRILRVVNIGDIDSLVAPPGAQQGQQGPDPKALADAANVQIKQGQLQLKQQQLQQDQVDTQREAAAQAVEAQARAKDQDNEMQIQAANLQIKQQELAAEHERAAAETIHARTELALDSAHRAADRQHETLRHAATLEQQDRHKHIDAATMARQQQKPNGEAKL